jgi:hypothetical protein
MYAGIIFHQSYHSDGFTNSAGVTHSAAFDNSGRFNHLGGFETRPYNYYILYL